MRIPSDLPHANEPDDNVHLRGLLTMVATGATIGALCLTAISSVLYALGFFDRPVSAFSVGGQVVDGVTGAPVADARVIVSVYRAGSLKAYTSSYGIKTNRDGRFSVTHKAPFNIKSQVDVEAVLPDDHINWASTHAKIVDGRYVASFVVSLKAQSVKNSDKMFRHYDDYDDFNKQELEIVGDRWLIGPYRHSLAWSLTR